MLYKELITSNKEVFVAMGSQFPCVTKLSKCAESRNALASSLEIKYFTKKIKKKLNKIRLNIWEGDLGKAMARQGD